jgi:hypothetical protein
MMKVTDEYTGQLQRAARLTLRRLTSDPRKLADLLYYHWYAPPRPERVPADTPEEVLSRLRAADAGRHQFEEGWVVVPPIHALGQIGPPPGAWAVAARRGQEVRWFDTGDFVYSGGVGVRPGPGASIWVSGCRDSTSVVPGWWTTSVRAWSHATPPMVRLYWAIEPIHLYALVATLTAVLSPQLPWALKAPLVLQRCRSPDCLVLYLSAVAWRAARPALQEVQKAFSRRLHDPVPALTLRLAPGLALAEDPASDSFGMSRCRVLAQGLWPALETAPVTEHGVTQAAELALRTAGLRLDAPYLNPGSTFEYSW